MGDPSCLLGRQREGIGLTIGVASRSKSEGSGISANQSLIQPALESDQSFQRLKAPAEKPISVKSKELLFRKPIRQVQ